MFSSPLLKNYFTCALTLHVQQVLPTVSRSPASSLVRGPAHLKTEVCSKCSVSVITGPDFFLTFFFFKKNKKTTFDHSIKFILPAELCSLQLISQSWELSSIFSWFSRFLCRLVPSWLRRTRKANNAPGLWARAGLCSLCAGLKVQLDVLGSCTLVKGRPPQRGSLGVIWAQAAGSFALTPLPSSLSPCWFWLLRGWVVKHPLTGRQLQVGEEPSCHSSAPCTLLWGP